MAVIRPKKALDLLHNSYLMLALRLFVGGTFLISAITKLPLQSQFVDIVKGYNLLPDALATAYGLALPWIELLIGIYLIVGILLIPSIFISLLIGASFLIANISSIVRGEHYCGSCFGEALSLSASQALTLDILLIVAALILLFAGNNRQVFSLEGWFARRQITKETDLEYNK